MKDEEYFRSYNLHHVKEDLATSSELDTEYTFPTDVVIREALNDYWKGYWDGFSSGYKECDANFGENYCGSLDHRIADAVRRNRRT